MAKGHPPLFEILQRGGSGEGAPPPPRSRGGPPSPARGSLSLPVWAVYVAITGVLALCVGVWVVAYQMGRSYGEQRVREQMRADLELSDPLLDGPAPGGEGMAGGLDGAWDGPGGAEPGVNGGGRPAGGAAGGESPSGPALAIGPSGPLTGDPREPSTNYLKLASAVSQGEARRALAFLAEQDFQAFGIRVEAGGPGANNPARYDLYAALAVPSKQFGAMGRQRRDVQERASELGRQWRAPPHRGAYDFSQSQWVLYRGP